MLEYLIRFRGINMSEYVPGMVSVIIPTYNRRRTLRRSIESVLAQTYQNLELLVIDDGSKDNSLELIQSLAKFFH